MIPSIYDHHNNGQHDHHHHHHRHHYYHQTTTATKSVKNDGNIKTTANNNNIKQEQQMKLVKCTLDNDQCINLDNILKSFQIGINEEQSWALCYQIIKCFHQYYHNNNNNNNKLSNADTNTSQFNNKNCYLINDPSQIYIHKDGYIHPKTLYQSTTLTSQGKIVDRILAKSSHKLLTSLGIVLFHALDYGLCDDEERTLSRPLEILIERLTTANELAKNNKHRQQRKRRSKKLLIHRTRDKRFNNQLNINTSTSSSSTTNVNDSIGSICSDNDVSNDDDDDDEENVPNDGEDYDEDYVEDDDDDYDNDYDIDEDECANTDEGIEQDCHEYGEIHNHSPLSLQSHGSPSSSTLTTTSSSSNMTAQTLRNQHGSNKNKNLKNFDLIMQMCASRLSSSETADNHYKAVCRALVAETLELSTFLDQIAKGTKELRKSSLSMIDTNNLNTNSHKNDDNYDTLDCETTLEKLQFHDWARLWIQVIRELRHGVKLKKVVHSDLSISHVHTEYELTPYEMLLDDIRSRRYKLNKVMVNGDLPPRVKKDAHELILDFIRSRPPLTPVSKRVLKPAPPKQITIYEKLMESIRQREHKLRPISQSNGLRSSTNSSLSASVTPTHFTANQNDDFTDGGIIDDCSMTQTPTMKNRRKKLVKANIKLDLFLDLNNQNENEEIFVEIPSIRKTTRPMSAYYPSEHFNNNDNDDDDDDEGKRQEEDEEKWDSFGDNNNSHNDELTKQMDANNNDDDNNNNNNTKTFQRIKNFSMRLLSNEQKRLRRHSISVCDLETYENFNQQQNEQDLIENIDFDDDRRNHVENIWKQNEIGKHLECLSLTLKEVQHIRSVLTKAEIESLAVTKSLKNDLENGKICFTCLKTRFTFWTSWATICKICNRSICDRCTTKMHIPIERFDRVPIYMLSPASSPPNEKQVNDLFKFTTNNHNNNIGYNYRSNEQESKSLPSKLISNNNNASNNNNRIRKFIRLLTINMTNDELANVGDGDNDNEICDNSNHKEDINYNHNPNKHQLVKVCRDCKILVRHLVDIGRTNFDGAKFQK